MSKKYPKCRICGVELAEAWKLKGESLYLCDDCFDLITAASHDAAVSVFEDVAKIMSGPVKPAVTWKHKLELVDLTEETEAK